MLNEHSGETLQRTEGSTVYHDRSLLLVVLVGVLQLEALGQVVVHLDGTQLPTTADGILDHEVQLRTIEGCLAVFYLGVQSLLLASLLDSFFSQCPVFVRTHILLVVVGVAE